MISLTIKRVLNNTSIIPIAATIACLLPFLNKAFHIDDPLFIWSAKHIQTSLFDFYGFMGNWYGMEMPMAEVIKNPPGTSYFIALVGFLFGWSEIALHTAFMIPALAAISGTYYLGKQFCSRPELAALAALLTPAFLVSSTNTMCDLMMLSLWVWSVVFWVEGIKANKPLKLLFSAGLISLCALTKYFGMALIGLLFFYSLMEKRRPGVWFFFLLIPILALMGYQWATYILYGRGLLSDASSYAMNYTWKGFSNVFSKGLVGLTFAGGCMIVPLFYIPFLWSRRTIASGIVLILFLIGALIFMGKIQRIPVHAGDELRWSFLLQFSIMAIVGISILGLAIADFLKCKDAVSLLLLLWIVGTFIFATFINWTINVRSFLPMVPAVGILLIRRINQLGKICQQKGCWRATWPLIPSLVVVMLVCWSDYMWANTARTAAVVIREKFVNHPGRVWFQGHWGFQYYMEAAGAKSLDFKHSKTAFEDIIIVPHNNSNVSPLRKEMVKLITTFQFKSSGSPLQWLTTKHRKLGAGFYSSISGPLPFAMGTVGPEKYYAYTLKKRKRNKK